MGKAARKSAKASTGAASSPRIRKCEWGKIAVEGSGTFKDAKLYPGGAREWDWDETGTQHQPGILPADVQELVDAGAKVIVLSQGMLGRLNIDLDTLLALSRKKVQVHILKTEDAVRRYNELRKTEKVGALIHTTC
jgi:hypothetical protein